MWQCAAHLLVSEFVQRSELIMDVGIIRLQLHGLVISLLGLVIFADTLMALAEVKIGPVIVGNVFKVFIEQRNGI